MAPLIDVMLRMPELPSQGKGTTNFYAVHAMLYRELARGGGRDFLFAEDAGALIVRSRNLPSDLAHAGKPVVVASTGDVLKFTLVASPMRKSGASTRQIDRDDEEGRLQWLHRQGALCGFEVIGDPSVVHRPVHFRKSGRQWWLERSEFRGVLRVVDADKFNVSLETGIGRARSMGFGLMRVHP